MINIKLYWILRSWWRNIIFKIKKASYIVRRKYENQKRTKSFSLLILKMIIKKLALSSIICISFIQIDKLILDITKTAALDNQLFLDIVIGGIGVSGVILGLYCSNTISIFSSKYTNAPESISKLYQQDILTNKCIKQIVGYITLCIVLLVVCISKTDFYYATVGLLLFLTIRTIITFSVAGNRAYDFSNTYRIADLVYPELYSSIKKLSNRNSIHCDENFQNHYRKICSKQLDILNDIAIYNETSAATQTAAVIPFLNANVGMLFFYLKNKPSIHYSSYWFSDKTKYQQWHIASDTETSMYVRYGRMLEPHKEKDYSWFESKIEEINSASLAMLIKSSDYTSIYSFLVLLSNVPNEIVQKSSLDYWAKYILSLRSKILPIIVNDKEKDDTNSTIIGVTDAYAVLIFNTIMNICEYIDKLDIAQELSYAVEIASTSNYEDIDFKKAVHLNSKRIDIFYNSILTERKIEKEKITPDWYIEQVVSKEIFDHINYLSNQLFFLYSEAYSIGETLLENKCYYSAAIWFSRLTEIYAKISNKQTFAKFEAIESESIVKKRDSEVIWNESNITRNAESIQRLSAQSIHSLKKCSSIFALTHSDNRTNFPDLLGYSYNLICDSLIKSIVENDYETFASLYDGFLGTTLLYQEYIRADLANPINNYNRQFAFGVFASPIVEFSMISGLAILWGEFIDSEEWRTVVEKELDPYKDTNDANKYGILPKIISTIKAHKSIRFGIGNRDTIQIGWEQSVSRAIRNHPNYKEEYGNHFDKYVKSNSKIFSAFSRHHLADLGVLEDTEELYLVLCINPYVKDEEKYHTNSKWEEMINDEK